VREDIEDALEEAAGDVTPHERALLKNVWGLHDLRVEDAMIPRADIVAISWESPLREALAVFRDAGHSACPSTPRRSTTRAAWSTSATS